MTENNKIKNRISEVAFEFERDYGNCPQVVCGAFMEILNFPNKEVFKSCSGIGGGLGKKGDVCGALIGGCLVIGSKSGREYEDFEEPSPTDCVKMVKELTEKFEEEYGSTNCKDIQEKIMGRSFDLWDEDDWIAFEEAGGHEDKCPSVTKNSAIWTFEILEKYDYLE